MSDHLARALDAWRSFSGDIFSPSAKVEWRRGNKQIVPPADVQAALDAAMNRNGNGGAARPTGDPMVDGYYDEKYDEYIASETQGPGSILDIDADEDDDVAASWLDYFALEDDERILHRWLQPDDISYALDLVAQGGLDYCNTEVLTEVRRRQLHKVVGAYFDGDYGRELVLRWEQDSNGRWIPAEKTTVLAFIEQRVAESASTLSGYASALASLRFRAWRKRYPKARRDKLAAAIQMRRILTDAEVEEAVGWVVSAVTAEADAAYDVSMDEAVLAFLEDTYDDIQ